MNPFRVLFGGVRLRPGLRIRLSEVCPEMTPDINPRDVLQRHTVRTTIKLEKNGTPISETHEVVKLGGPECP